MHKTAESETGFGYVSTGRICPETHNCHTCQKVEGLGLSPPNPDKYPIWWSIVFL